jgi:hypothetical protein
MFPDYILYKFAILLYVAEMLNVFLGTEFMCQGVIKWGFAICMANTAKDIFIPAAMAHYDSLENFKNQETSDIRDRSLMARHAQRNLCRAINESVDLLGFTYIVKFIQ